MSENLNRYITENCYRYITENPIRGGIILCTLPGGVQNYPKSSKKGDKFLTKLTKIHRHYKVSKMK